VTFISLVPTIECLADARSAACTTVSRRLTAVGRNGEAANMTTIKLAMGSIFVGFAVLGLKALAYH
jgi:hypothetical protein